MSDQREDEIKRREEAYAHRGEVDETFEPIAIEVGRTWPRPFVLVRDEDETGISGVGVVAEGVEFSDGQAVIRWIVGEFRSTSVWAQGMEAVDAIHGHGGKTRIVWQ